MMMTWQKMVMLPAIVLAAPLTAQAQGAATAAGVAPVENPSGRFDLRAADARRLGTPSARPATRRPVWTSPWQRRGLAQGATPSELPKPRALRPASTRTTGVPAAAGSARAPAGPNTFTLEQAIKRARRKNLQLKAAKVGIHEAKVARKLSYGMLGPHFSLQLDLQFLGGDSGFDFDTSSAMDPANLDFAALCPDPVTSAQCLAWYTANGQYVGEMMGMAFAGFGSIGDIFLADTFKVQVGGFWALSWTNLVNLKRTKLGIKLSREAYRNTSQTVATNVTTTYYGALMAQESVRILKASAMNTKEHLKQAQNLIKGGVGSNLDVLRWKTKIAEDAMQLLQAEQQVAAAKVALNNFLGRPLRAPLELVVPAALRDGGRLSPPTRASKPLGSHPALRLTKLQTQMKQADRQGAQAAFLPTLELSGGYTWQHYLPHEDINDGSSWLGSWAVMLSVKLPIFDSMTKVYNLRLKTLAVKKARLEERHLKRQLQTAVIQADLQVQKAWRQIAVANTQVALATEAHQSAERLYKAGSGKTIDVLDAQNASRMARLSLLMARYSYLSALAQRNQAQGKVR